MNTLCLPDFEYNRLAGSREEDYDLIVKEFVRSLTIAPTSKVSYSKNIAIFLSWLKSTGRPLGALTSQDLADFYNHLQDSGLRPHTINAYVATLHRFYAWTEANRLYPNISTSLKMHRQKKEFVKMHLRTPESNALLTDVYTSREVNALRNYAIVNLMLHTGLRTIEVCRANIGDIQQKLGRRILKIWGKGELTAESEVILTDEAYKPIKDYLDTRRGANACDPLFTNNSTAYSRQGTRMSTRSIQMLIKKHMRNIGLDSHEYSAHSLRHTAAVEIIHQGGNVQDVKRTLRHANIDTSLIYLGSIEEEERFKNPGEDLLDGLFESPDTIEEKTQ